MKKVRCPKCEGYTIFDETRYQPGQRLVFECSQCHRQFGIRLPGGNVPAPEEEEEKDAPSVGYVVVVENAFQYKQTIPLEMGDNVFGRYVQGTKINKPIETVDPSIDTRHCIIRVQRNKQGQLQFILRDAPSGTGTFYMNSILRDQDRVRLEDGSIVTIGATTMILHTEPFNPDEK